MNEAVHATKKRIASTAYSMASMLEMEPIIESTGRNLLRRLEEEFIAREKRPCDLGKWLHFYAFDVLGEVAFSQQFGF